MNKRALSIASLCILIAGVLGFIFSATRERGYVLHGDGTRAGVGGTGMVSITPSTYRFPNDVMEHDVAKVTLELSNQTAAQVQVVSAIASCSCVRVETSDGKLILSPISVPAGGHIPLNVLVNTAGQFGRYQHSVAVRCRDSSGMDSTTTADIELHVAGALYAFPNPIFIDNADPGQPITKEIDFYDAFPGSGIEIVAVSSSDSRTVRVEVLTDFERRVISAFDPGGSHNSRADFKHRHRLRVTITPPDVEDAWLRDSVVIKTSRDKAPPVVVPITVRTKQPAWKMRPNALLITLGAGQLRAARKVRCYLDRSKVPGEVVVLDCPAFVTAHREGSDGDIVTFVVEVVAPEGAPDRLTGKIDFGCRTDTSQKRELPVTVVKATSSR